MTDVTLGASLRAAREAAGMSVEDVSAHTRIRCTLVRDLEGDRVASSGAAVYARGHVKSICAAIGADPAPFLELFSRQAGSEWAEPLPMALPEPRPATGERLVVPRAARPERRGPHWAAAGTAALVVLVALLAVGKLTKSDSPVADAAVVTRPPAAGVHKPAPAKKLTATRALPSGAELRLRLLGGDSWVSVRSGSRTLFEGMLRNGTVKDFRDPAWLRLDVGNAGAVNVVCAGRDLRPAGARGAVRHFTCSTRGIVPA